MSYRDIIKQFDVNNFKAHGSSAEKSEPDYGEPETCQDDVKKALKGKANLGRKTGGLQKEI